MSRQARAEAEGPEEGMVLWAEAGQKGSDLPQHTTGRGLGVGHGGGSLERLLSPFPQPLPGKGGPCQGSEESRRIAIPRGSDDTFTPSSFFTNKILVYT